MAANDPVEKFGIAANIDFPLPASFIWDCSSGCYRRSPKRALLTNRAWLETDDSAAATVGARRLYPVGHYLTDDSDKRKLFQLSSKARTCLTSIWSIVRTGWHSGKQTSGRRVGRSTGLASAVVEGVVEYTDELGQPRWHRANLYQALSKRWSPRRPARRGYLRASYMRYFRVTACLSPGATGAG